jgi:hypothetical protein
LVEKFHQFLGLALGSHNLNASWFNSVSAVCKEL